MNKAEAMKELHELCGEDGQAVERMFALSKSEFWTVRIEEDARDKGRDGLYHGYRHNPERLAEAKANIAAYEAAHARYMELVSILSAPGGE